MSSNTNRLPWMDRVQYVPSNMLQNDVVIKSASDALVYRQFDDRYVITSPNATYIPQLNIGNAQILVTEDAKLGVFDPILHPQIYSPDSLFLAAIPRPPDNLSTDHVLYMIWHCIILSDIEDSDATSDVILKTSLRESLTTAVNDILQECRNAPTQIQESPVLLKFCNAITDGVSRLKRPSPFRLLIQHIAFVQRNWLLLRGYLTYFVDLPTSTQQIPFLNMPVPRALPLLGAFTNNIDVVESLQRMRIPVWYLRFEYQIHSTDLFSEWAAVERLGWWVRSDLGLFGQLAFKGSLGAQYIHWYGTRWSPQYLDIDPNPTILGRAPALDIRSTLSIGTHQPKQPTSHSTLSERNHPRHKNTKAKSSAPITSKVHTPKKQEHESASTIHRSQFDDPVLLMPLHPRRGTIWQLAMMACDLRRSHPANPWKMWCPDPATLLRGELPRQRRIFWKWLHIRQQWFHALEQSISSAEGSTLLPLRPQAWRDILMATTSPHDPNTRSAQRRQNTIDAMKPLPMHQLLESEEPIQWRNKTFRSCDAIDERDLSGLAWELAEVNFRMELLHVDRILCSPEISQRESENERCRLVANVFPYHSPIIPMFPDCQVGIISQDFRQRAPYLEALRVIMARWTSCPEAVKQSACLVNHPSQSYIEDLESRMALHYIQAFWETAGRAPQIPLRVPI